MQARFIMDLRIFDVQAVFDVALEHAVEVDGMTETDARDLLAPGGEISVEACLVMVLDPSTISGAEIDMSDVVILSGSEE
jgi:hypothetical protein